LGRKFLHKTAAIEGYGQTFHAEYSNQLIFISYQPTSNTIKTYFLEQA